jgi:hypothetical protein
MHAWGRDGRSSGQACTWMMRPMLQTRTLSAVLPHFTHVLVVAKLDSIRIHTRTWQDLSHAPHARCVRNQLTTWTSAPSQPSRTLSMRRSPRAAKPWHVPG